MAMMRMSQSFISNISASWKKKYGHTAVGMNAISINMKVIYEKYFCKYMKKCDFDEIAGYGIS